MQPEVCSGGPQLPDRQRSLVTERRKLQRALLDLCFERGYPRIDLPQLLERAGVGETDFKHHFADLEDCFCSALEAERDAFFVAIDAALAEHSSWVDRLRAAAYAMLAFLRADQRRAHFLTIELQRAGERAIRIWSQTIVAPLFELIDAGRAERDGAQLSRATTDAVGGALFSRINAAAAAGTLLEEGEAAIPQMMYAAVLPYLGPEAAAAELRIPPPQIRIAK